MLQVYRELATFIAGELGVTYDQLFRIDKTRKRYVVETRYAIILLLDNCYSEYRIVIGPLFGYPDHSMACTSVKTARIWYENDKKFRALYNEVEKLSQVYLKTI